MWLHASHRDPAAWESPNAFQPSRWHDTIAPATADDGDQTEKAGQNFQPFASGQRSCVGQHVAMATLRVVFGQLLETFTFSENASEYPIADEMVQRRFYRRARFGAGERFGRRGRLVVNSNSNSLIVSFKETSTYLLYIGDEMKMASKISSQLCAQQPTKIWFCITIQTRRPLSSPFLSHLRR